MTNREDPSQIQSPGRPVVEASIQHPAPKSKQHGCIGTPLIVLGAMMMVLGALTVGAALTIPPGHMGGFSMALVQSGVRGWDERSVYSALGATLAGIGGFVTPSREAVEMSMGCCCR